MFPDDIECSPCHECGAPTTWDVCHDCYDALRAAADAGDGPRRCRFCRGDETAYCCECV